MPLEARLITGLALALAVVYWSTPIAIRVADRLEFYDKPAGYKGHARATPYLGGSALIAGFVVALLLLASDWSRTAPVVFGVLVLWAVGTIDDRRNVAWWARVLVELALAVLLWATGLGWDLGLGAGIDLALTAFWLVAVVNAFNLFDNMDGQSATMGLVTSVGLAALGVAVGNTWVAVAGAAMAGACFGFLPHNLLSQPARIFLGDGGSMPLGFAIASVAMIGAVDAAGEWQALALGLLLVGVPALDTTLVVVSRRRRGLSVLTPGRDHLTHRARQRLRTAFAVAVALGSAQIVISLMAVAASRGSALELGAVAGAYLVLLGVAVALIDTRIPAVPPDAPTPAAPGIPARPRHLAWLPREAPALVLLGIGAAISPWFEGYYGAGVWAPMALGLLVCLLAVGIARPPRLARAAWLALGGLAAYGLWGLTSALWADSIEQAVVDSNRVLALAAALGLLLLLVRDRRSALWVLGSFAVAGAVFELIEVVRLLGGGSSHFLGGRLNEPLGYINAQATYSILVLWAMIALAENRRSAVAAGLGAGMAALSASLVLLSQSRGAGLAVLGSALVVLAVVPGRHRRGLLLALTFAGMYAASSDLLDIYRAGTPTDGDVRTGITSALVSAIVCGVVWGVLVAFERGLPERARAQLRRATAIGFALLAVVALAGAAANAGRIGDEIDRQYDAFVHLGAAEGGEATASRLLSGAGNRYDYWRVAKDAWADAPVLGVGAGNYDQPYFLERSTAEDVRQPHSMVLQALAELGLPGLLMVLVFFGGVGWGAWRHRARAREDRAERLLLTAATGIFAGWLVHTQVDWIHLLPGVTLGALIAAAVLLRPTAPAAERERPQTRFSRPVPRSLVAVAIMVPVAVAGVSISRQALAQHYRSSAQDAVSRGDAEAAIRDADRALRLDVEDLRSYYAKAAALARLGDADGAQRVLEQAVRVEPGDFLPYALLGDLSIRRRDFEAAGRYYGEALARNPREPALIQLADDPRAALTR